ncbi:hypothetical protein GCM10027591_12750 [Zhihengliuella somnathii]
MNHAIAAPARRRQHRYRRTAVGLLASLGLLAPLAGAAYADPAPYGPAGSSAECASAPWMDATATPEERADALLEASTQHQIYRWLVEQPANAPQQTDFDGVAYPAQVPCTPEVVYTDGPDGVRFTEGTTAFPAPISMASTWNTDLAEAKGSAQADEAFDSGKNGVLAPGLAGGRTPLSGRTPEYFGEDPLLSGLFTAATVNGLENGDPNKPVISDIKHYVANEQELDRSESSSNVSDRAFHEIYALPFEISVNRSEPGSVMCSYNQINGTYACEHPLLQEHLKDDLGFGGYVVSDFGAVHSTAAALMNGLDQELNRPIHFTPEKLDAALAAGDITQERIEEAATRVVTAYIRSGLFDTPLPEPTGSSSTDEHRALARQTATEGTVLLKNDGALPLALDSGTSIAVIGSTASADVVQDADGNDLPSARSVCSMPWAFGGGTTLTCENLVAPLEALTDAATAAGASVTFNPGDDAASAAADAAAADVALVFGYQRMGEFSDLDDLRLQGNGDALIEAVAAANEDTVVVLNNGSAVEMPWIDDVAGVFAGWYGGEQFGPALVDLLTGAANPSGKLPMTFPATLEQAPTQSGAQYPGLVDDSGIRQVDYSEGLQVGYRWYAAQGLDPLFAFGHGLSYADFEYSHVRVTPRSTNGAKDITVRFRLTNTSEVAGTETAQVYVELPEAAGQPSKRLIGHERVTLEPGEHRNVALTLTAEDLSELRLLQYWDEAAGAWATADGDYTVTVGGSFDAAAGATFTVR